MADRYAFTSPFSKGGEPWFKVGQIEVTTTVALLILTIIAMFWSAIEGSTALQYLPLATDSVTEGQVWRIISWPFYNDISLWTFISIVVLYLLGSQLELQLGKTEYMILISTIIILPAIIISISAFFTNQSDVSIFGIRFITLGLIIAIAAMNPFAMFFLRIPAWVLAGAFVLLELLSYLAEDENLAALFIIIISASIVLALKSLGRAHPTFDWVPAVPLPTENTVRNKKSKKSKAKLDSILTTQDEVEMNILLDKISHSGEKSLSKAEKKKLKIYSNKIKNNGEL